MMFCLNKQPSFYNNINFYYYYIFIYIYKKKLFYKVTVIKQVREMFDKYLYLIFISLIIFDLLNTNIQNKHIFYYYVSKNIWNLNSYTFKIIKRFIYTIGKRVCLSQFKTTIANRFLRYSWLILSDQSVIQQSLLMVEYLMYL